MNKDYEEKNITMRDRLKEIRLDSGLSQSEFSKKLSVKQSYYSDLENGKREITTKVITSLSENFNVSSEWLLFNIGNKYQNTSAIEMGDKEVSMSSHSNISKIQNSSMYTSQLLEEYSLYFQNLPSSQITMIKVIKREELKDVYLSYIKLASFLQKLDKDKIISEKFKCNKDVKTYISECELEIAEDLNGIKDDRLISAILARHYITLIEFWIDQVKIIITHIDRYSDLLLS